jgi:hypothetical protein
LTPPFLAEGLLHLAARPLITNFPGERLRTALGRRGLTVPTALLTTLLAEKSRAALVPGELLLTVVRSASACASGKAPPRPRLHQRPRPDGRSVTTHVALQNQADGVRPGALIVATTGIGLGGPYQKMYELLKQRYAPARK